MKVWIKDEKHNKLQKPILKIFSRTLKNLEREFRKQEKLLYRTKSCSLKIKNNETLRLKLNYDKLSTSSNEKQHNGHKKKHKCNIFFLNKKFKLF